MWGIHFSWQKVGDRKQKVSELMIVKMVMKRTNGRGCYTEGSKKGGEVL